MIFAGQVIDSKTGAGVPFASVRIISDGIHAQGVSADKEGYFSLSGAHVAPPNSIEFSQAEYYPETYELEFSDEYNAIIPLTRKIKELPPVVVESGGGKDNNKSFPWLLIAAGAAVAVSQNQNKVGKIEFNLKTVVAGAAVVAALKAFNIIDSITNFLGLTATKDEKEVDIEETNPLSPLAPEIYLRAPDSVKQKLYQEWIVNGKLNDLANELDDAFGYMNDNEAAAKGVFTQMPSQVVSSMFAYGWQNSGLGNLVTWLRGDTWPNDRLSSEELNEIIKYLKKLPKGY